MEFDKSRVYTSLNADELKPGDKVIVGDTLDYLRRKVADGKDVQILKDIADEQCTSRFIVATGFDCLAYLIERAENCTNCRLCNGSIKNDPTEVCENYEPQNEPPANCETCSKADTDRCPVPNPPKKTGCGHWESKPARVCENCRNLECYGKDNNWCEVREIKLSDEAIKKNTCGYFKLVKEGPKTEKKAYEYDVPIKGQFNEDGVIVERQVGECHVKVKPFTEEAEKVCENVMTKAEPHYRPFRDTDELIKVWLEKVNWGVRALVNNTMRQPEELTMPLIWVRFKGEAPNDVCLINGFNGDEPILIADVWMSLETLFESYEFLDGSPCGVRE